MRINPLHWSASRRQLVFILTATVGFTPSAYSYWRSESERAVFASVFIAYLLIFLAVSVSVFIPDDAGSTN